MRIQCGFRSLPETSLLLFGALGPALSLEAPGPAVPFTLTSQILRSLSSLTFQKAVSPLLCLHSECTWLLIFRKPLWKALEHLHSALVLPQGSSSPGSRVGLEDPALSPLMRKPPSRSVPVPSLRLGMGSWAGALPAEPADSRSKS